MIGTYKETAFGVRLDRAKRREVLALAQQREIDTVLVTEQPRWGRSTTDLLATLKDLEAQRVSLAALIGMAFELKTPHGRMMAVVDTYAGPLTPPIAGWVQQRHLASDKFTLANNRFRICL